MKETDLLIIGGGPAAMGAALGAREAGVKNILLLERAEVAGGILNQCIHNGFGLHYFKEELTGPEYAHRFIQKLKEENIEILLNTMVVDITNERVVTAFRPGDASAGAEEGGVLQIKAKAIVLAMGCRERSRGALNIPGSRPAGVFTAGAAQRFVNIEGYMPGKEIVILGSGDIGLIMARRMSLEGARVKMVCELLPFSGGLQRNIVQCLEDFNIPLRLSHTVIKVHGKDRVSGVTIAKVDENRKPIQESYEYIPCDTLLLSVGLIPENELSEKAGVELDSVTGGPIVNESMETTVSGIFACGNVVHVHDLVDYVTLESIRAGKGAARFIERIKQEQVQTSKAATGTTTHKDAITTTTKEPQKPIQTKAGKSIRYIIPHVIRLEQAEDKIQLFFRVTDVYKNKKLNLLLDGESVKSVKKKHLAPGEMESLEVSKEILVGKSRLSLELEDEND